MAKYDLSTRMIGFLDPHMVFSLLDFLSEKEIYDPKDLQRSRVELAERTKMVDFYGSEYEAFYEKPLEGVDDMRAKVHQELEDTEQRCGALLEVLNDADDLAVKLKGDGNFTFDFLHTNHKVTTANVDALFDYARLNFEVGRYQDSADYLFYYRLLTGVTDGEKSFWALWGKLAAEILLSSFDHALADLEELCDAIDQRIHVDQLEQLQQRSWLIHWSLFIFFHIDNGRTLLIDFMLDEKRYKLLNTIQVNCPHILRYLTVAIILDKKKRSSLNDLVHVLQQEKDNYTDPIVEFLLLIYIEFDFDKAAAKLQECRSVLDNDFFLSLIAEEFLTNARVLLFETYCRIHRTIDITTIAKALGIDTQEQIEKMLIDMIWDSRVEAKIDIASNTVVMANEHPSVYQQVLDKTKFASMKATQLSQQIEKRLSAQKEE